jgi:hypothetical protein
MVQDPAARQPAAAVRDELHLLLTTLGLGLFISTISNTQQQAMMTATFFVMTPMMYLSGFIFPIENMPAVIQPFTYPDSAALLHHHRARDLPEGRRMARAVASRWRALLAGGSSLSRWRWRARGRR